MDLLQLHYFITIAETQHITRAAEQLHVSQPSLSNTLSRIENELGAKLFDRQGRNILLNDYGRIVLIHAKNVFRELDNLSTEISALQDQQSHCINIGSVDSTYVKDWLPRFIETHPDIVIHHVIASCAALEAQLANGAIDFAITDTRALPEYCESYVLGRDEYVVLTPLESKISSGNEPVAFSLFRDEPFICSPKTEDILRPIDLLSKEAAFTPNIIFEGSQDLLSRLQQLNYGNIIATISRIERPQYMALCKKIPVSSPSPTILLAIMCICSGIRNAHSLKPASFSSIFCKTKLNNFASSTMTFFLKKKRRFCHYNRKHRCRARHRCFLLFAYFVKMNFCLSSSSTLTVSPD